MMSLLRSDRPRAWAVASVVAMAAAAMVSGGPASAASGAARAAKPDAESFSSSFTATTSTGQRLRVVVAAQTSSGIGGADTVVTVTLASLGGAESHQWGFPVLASAFTLSPTGNGKLVVPRSSIAPYGVVKLSLSAGGKPKKQSCSASTYVTTQKLKVRGIVFFDSRSGGHHGWGHLGSKQKRITFSGEGFEGYGQVYSTCVATTSPCVRSLTWSASDLSGSGQFVGGTTGKSRGFISATRSVVLPKPRNSTRLDSVSVTAPPPKLKRGTDGSATLTVHTPGGIATGNGRVVSTQAGNSSQVPCGKSQTQTQLDWFSSWKNGKPPLTLRAAVFGSFKLANGSQGSIDDVSK